MRDDFFKFKNQKSAIEKSLDLPSPPYFGKIKTLEFIYPQRGFKASFFIKI